MAVYREKRRSRLLPLLGIAAALVILGMLWLVLGVNRPAGQTPRDSVASGLRDVSNDLDLFLIEYPKLLAGGNSGAMPALGRARSDFEKIRPDLAALDPAAAGSFVAALRQVEGQASAKATAADVGASVDKLRADIGAWLVSH
ncbi:MAG: hypothetical protein ACR2M0_16230 [Chloroflexia bacterium]